jgi:hypothetical protein
MQWVNVHIPRQVADEVGATAVRSGVARDQAIAAALWVFSRLSVTERAALIRTYLAEGTGEVPAKVRLPGA